MSKPFHVLITNHPIDGVKLALRTNGAGHSGDQRLILVTGGGVNTALSFGYVLPPEYTGLGGLLRYPANSLAVEVEDGAHQAQVVFPSPSSGHLDDYAELLDRLRSEFSEWKEVFLIIEYQRVLADLPPLGKDDLVTCAWEARDLLTETVASSLQYVGDRIENDGAKFRGLQLYTRQAGLKAVAEERRTKISKETKIPFLPEVLELEASAERPDTPPALPPSPPQPEAKKEESIPVVPPTEPEIKDAPPQVAGHAAEAPKTAEDKPEPPAEKKSPEPVVSENQPDQGPGDMPPPLPTRKPLSTPLPTESEPGSFLVDLPPAAVEHKEKQQAAGEDEGSQRARKGHPRPPKIPTGPPTIPPSN